MNDKNEKHSGRFPWGRTEEPKSNEKNKKSTERKEDTKKQ